MKIVNNSARPYTVRGVLIAPGAVSPDLPDDAEKDIEGIDDLKPATRKELKQAGSDDGSLPMGAQQNPMASTNPDGVKGGTQVPENAKQADKNAKGK